MSTQLFCFVFCFVRGGTDGRRGNFQMNATRWQHPIVHTLILLRVHYICLREKWKKKILMTHKKESISTESVISIGAMTPPQLIYRCATITITIVTDRWRAMRKQLRLWKTFFMSTFLFYFLFFTQRGPENRQNGTIDRYTHTHTTNRSVV